MTCLVEGKTAFAPRMMAVPRNFQIEADEQRLFIKYQGREISPNELTQIALEHALFTVKEPKYFPDPSMLGGDAPWS